MAEEHTIVDIMKAFTQALVDKDTDKAISFLTEDAVWISPNGKFSNIAEIRKYIEWMNNNIADQYITGIGLDVLVKANVGIYEQRIGGISRGRKWNASALCIYEFRDNKINSIRMVYDRLDVAQQVTMGIAKTAVSNIVREMEKGLH